MLKLKDCTITHFEDDCYISQGGTTYTPDLYDESEFIFMIYNYTDIEVSAIYEYDYTYKKYILKYAERISNNDRF